MNVENRRIKRFKKDGWVQEAPYSRFECMVVLWHRTYCSKLFTKAIFISAAENIFLTIPEDTNVRSGHSAMSASIDIVAIY